MLQQSKRVSNPNFQDVTTVHTFSLAKAVFVKKGISASAQTHHLSIIIPQYPRLEEDGLEERLWSGSKKLTRNGDPYPFYDDRAIRKGHLTWVHPVQPAFRLTFLSKKKNPQKMPPLTMIKELMKNVLL